MSPIALQRRRKKAISPQYAYLFLARMERLERLVQQDVELMQPECEIDRVDVLG